MTTTALKSFEVGEAEALFDEVVESPIYWPKDVSGEKCQVCPNTIQNTFYDMRTTPAIFKGAWGILCPKCATVESGVGVGFCGQGFGQRYNLQHDGQWLLTEGMGTELSEVIR